MSICIWDDQVKKFCWEYLCIEVPLKHVFSGGTNKIVKLDDHKLYGRFLLLFVCLNNTYPQNRIPMWEIVIIKYVIENWFPM